MVRLIIGKRIFDSQPDERDLSTRDIGEIIEALTNPLEAKYQLRVEYPWERKEHKDE